jgi:hypothetical protein
MNVTINGVKYTPVNSSGEIRIVILQRGWVMVGRYSRNGDDCQLTNARVIRNWGTTKGLGELAGEGPKKETKLDPTNGLVEFHRLTEIATVKCNEEKWKSEIY